jgi:hypothetical protein
MAARSFRPAHKGSFAPGHKRRRTTAIAPAIPRGVDYDHLAELIARREACARDAHQFRDNAASARRQGDHEAAFDHLQAARAEEAEFDRLNTIIAGLGGTRR